MIREYVTTDKEAVIGIYDASKLDELLYEKQRFQLIPLANDLQRSRLIFGSTILLSTRNVPNGFVAYRNNIINGLYVHPAHRGKGLGYQLLNKALSALGGHASLQVASSNKPARQLYSTLGFQPVEEYDVDYNGVIVKVTRMIVDTF